MFSCKKIVCENVVIATIHVKLTEWENYVFLQVFRTPHGSRLPCQRAVPNENAQRSLRWMTYTGNAEVPNVSQWKDLCLVFLYPEAKLNGKSYANVESRVSLCVARRCCEVERFVKFIFRQEVCGGDLRGGYTRHLSENHNCRICCTASNCNVTCFFVLFCFL